MLVAGSLFSRLRPASDLRINAEPEHHHSVGAPVRSRLDFPSYGLKSLVVNCDHRPAFGLAEASPDAVRFTNPQRVLQARLTHHARRANRFRLLFSLELVALPLEVTGRKEDDSLWTATSGPNLPSFIDTLCTHRHPPFQRRTIHPHITLNKVNFRKRDACKRQTFQVVNPVPLPRVRLAPEMLSRSD